MRFHPGEMYIPKDTLEQTTRHIAYGQDLPRMRVTHLQFTHLLRLGNAVCLSTKESEIKPNVEGFENLIALLVFV